MTATDTARNLALVAAQAAADKSATDVVVIDVSDRLALADCFVIATGSNERQVGAIVDHVSERMSGAGSKVRRREGERDGRWVLLDFGGVIVHVQHAEERVFYALDRLWGDCPTIPFVDSALPTGAGSANGDGGGNANSDGDGDANSDGDGGSDDPDEAVSGARL